MKKNKLFSPKKKESCPQCGGELVIKQSSNHRLFLACNNYPECHYFQPLTANVDEHIIKTLDGQFCPECHQVLVLRQGRYGMFIGCSGYPECPYAVSINDQNDTQIICPQCKQGHLLQRQSRYGKTFYACNTYPRCKFVLNNQPVDGECPYCHYPLLVRKNLSSLNEAIFCANKQCGKKVLDE